MNHRNEYLIFDETALFLRERTKLSKINYMELSNVRGLLIKRDPIYILVCVGKYLFTYITIPGNQSVVYSPINGSLNMKQHKSYTTIVAQ